MELNIIAVQEYVKKQVEAGWRFNNPTNQDLLNILDVLISPVEQEVCGKALYAGDAGTVCNRPKPCPIHDKTERTYTETEIENLLRAVKIHQGYHGSACVCVGCLLIKNWQSLKHSKRGGE